MPPILTSMLLLPRCSMARLNRSVFVHLGRPAPVAKSPPLGSRSADRPDPAAKWLGRRSGAGLVFALTGSVSRDRQHYSIATTTAAGKAAAVIAQYRKVRPRGLGRGLGRAGWAVFFSSGHLLSLIDGLPSFAEVVLVFQEPVIGRTRDLTGSVDAAEGSRPTRVPLCRVP
jgi:hypothetical protein